MGHSTPVLANLRSLAENERSAARISHQGPRVRRIPDHSDKSQLGQVEVCQGPKLQNGLLHFFQVKGAERIAFALRPHASGVEASPERLQTVEDRLARLERIKRRYGPTLADVVRRRAELREESSQLDTGACIEFATKYRDVAGDHPRHYH
jgi:hypothetical protein